MDLSKWNVREFRLEGTDGDVGFILYRPITHGWRTRHLELSLKLQNVMADLKDLSEADDPNHLSEEEVSTLVSSQKDAMEVMAQFRGEMISDLVVGCRDLTINDEVPSRDDLVSLLANLEDLSSDLCTHILEEGSVSEDEGKD